MAGELRFSDYEGTPDAIIGYAEQGFTADYGGVASNYSSTSPVIGATCMTIGGQGGFHYDGTLAARTYWTGWWRSNSTPTSNRLIVDFQAGSSTQASISIDTARKWRLRNQAGVAVQASTITYTDGVWYGMVWWADSSTGTQEMKIYDATGTLLETLSGGCGTTAFTRQREGILQGSNDWSCSYDCTAVDTAPIALTFPSTGPEEHTGSLGLSGTGTLGSTGLATILAQGALNLSGTGVLTVSASAAEHHTGSVSVSGTGSLAASLDAVELSGTATLSGEGITLPAAIPGGVGSADSSSEGTLSLAASASWGHAAALGGTGTLSTSASVLVRRTLLLGSEGDLGVVGSAFAEGAGSVSLGGSGTLTPIASYMFHLGAAPLGGEGELEATGVHEIPAAGTAALSGVGSLGVVQDLLSASADLDTAGSGQLSLSGTASEGYAATANLGGTGDLDLDGQPHLVGWAITFGFGSSSQYGSPATTTDALLFGEGHLSAGDGRKAYGTAALSGAGMLSTAGSLGIQWVMVLPGEGKLAATGWAIQHFQGEANFTGNGLLSAGRSDSIPRDITVTARLGERKARSAQLLQNRRWSADLL